jgi:hypothetical protein
MAPQLTRHILALLQRHPNATLTFRLAAQHDQYEAIVLTLTDGEHQAAGTLYAAKIDAAMAADALTVESLTVIGETLARKKHLAARARRDRRTEP